MRTRLLALLAVFAASAIAGSASAQFLSVSADLNSRAWPAGVSIPTIGNTDTVYPGCPTPPTSYGHVWYFSPSGQTQASGGDGSSAHPWSTPQALWGYKPSGILSPSSGYSQMLLSTAPAGVGGTPGPIQPGDEVVLATGSYGDLVSYDAQSVNSPALTIAAGSGQTPLFTTINLAITGLVLNGIQVRELNDVFNAPLIALNGGGNITLENMDVSSAAVATADGWTQAQWQANARQGLVSFAANCVSVVDSHFYVIAAHNEGAIHDLANNALVQNDEIDHYANDAVNFEGNNVAVENLYIHDTVLWNPGLGDQYYGIRNVGVYQTALQSNITIARIKLIESIDTSQLFNAPLSGFLNSNGDITNFTIYDVLCACTGNDIFGTGNIHNALIANNSLMGTGSLNALQGHGGSTGPAGYPPSNVRIVNNIAPAYETDNNVQSIIADHNISTINGAFNTAWIYCNGLTAAQTKYDCTTLMPTPGSVIAAPVGTGPNNTADGIGMTNEYTSVYGSGSFPMSPQPDWTPLSGSPAKTVGGAVLIPPLTDYNGAAFTPPYSIGGLN
jgi:hypothetical protein